MFLRGPRRLILLAALLPFTLAAASPAPSGTSKVFSVYPAQEGNTTLPGGHYNFALTAGATQSDGIVIQNFSDHDLQVDIYPADLIQIPGGITETQKGALLKGVGSWITVAAPSVTIPAQHQTTVPFTIKVPIGVTPASNAGAIVAAAFISQGSTSVQAREALLVQVNIPGTARPGGQLSALKESSDSTDQSKKFTVDLTNTGNVLINQGGWVVIRDAQGNEVARLPLIPGTGYAVPGGVLHLVTASSWEHGYGTYTAQAVVNLSYDGGQGPVKVADLVSNTLSYSYVDWRIIAGAVVAGLLVLFVLVRILLGYLRRRRMTPEQKAERARLAQIKREAEERLKKLK